MEKDLLELGKVVAIHALKGEIRLQPWCDTPDFAAGFKKVRHPVAGNDVEHRLAGHRLPGAHQHIANQYFDLLAGTEPAGLHSIGENLLSIHRLEHPFPDSLSAFRGAGGAGTACRP